MNQRDVQACLQRAVQHHQQGMLLEAERAYRQVLNSQPRHFDALQLLGAIRISRKDYATAIEFIGRAIAINPNFAKAYANFGLALHCLKQPREALAYFDRAIQLNSSSAETLRNRAEVLLSLRRSEEALSNCNQALAIDPTMIAAHQSRSVALAQLARFDEALASLPSADAHVPGSAPIHCSRAEVMFLADRLTEAFASYELALELQPHYPEALLGKANVLAAWNRLAEAIAVYTEAIALNPNYVDALSRRAAAYAQLGRFDESLRDYHRALACAPHDADTLYNYGVTLVELRRYEDAIRSFDAAIASRPGDATNLNNCGFALAKFRCFDQAIACFDAALAVKPQLFEALTNKADALLRLSRYDEALATFEKGFAANPQAQNWFDSYCYAEQFACDWRHYVQHAERMHEILRTSQAQIAPLVLMSIDSDNGEQLQCAKRFATARDVASTERFSVTPPYSHARIRVAYLSANFNQHPVAYAIVDLLEKHDRSRFQIIGVSLGGDDGSEIRSRIANSCDAFHDVSTTADRDVATLLRDLEVDIAVDLMGYTDEGRPKILGYRPAPIQVNYLGYPGTMGADYIDYLLADSFVVPQEQRQFYHEQVVYLPHCYFPASGQKNANKQSVDGQKPSKASQGLPERSFVFCCFNTHYKITPPVFDVWLTLLSRVDDSVLWLQGNNLTAQRNLRDTARTKGIDPQRLIFAERLANSQHHLARLALADLFLDTFPYNAHSTARDALQAGLPLVTYSGNTFASRVAGSILRAADLPELVASTLDEYQEIALRLARDPKALLHLRNKIQSNRFTAPGFDSNRFSADVEAAFIEMIERHNRGEPPRSFAVPSFGPR